MRSRNPEQPPGHQYFFRWSPTAAQEVLGLKLLCVTAHPDDEAGNFGGTLLRYAQRGVETYPVSLAPATAEIDITEFFDTKIAAFKQHQSRSPILALFEGRMRQRGTKEYFHLAASSKPRTAERETDLFAGVTHN